VLADFFLGLSVNLTDSYFAQIVLSAGKSNFLFLYSMVLKKRTALCWQKDENNRAPPAVRRSRDVHYAARR
jgi:hypothetical protein